MTVSVVDIFNLSISHIDRRRFDRGVLKYGEPVVRGEAVKAVKESMSLSFSISLIWFYLLRNII